MNSAMLFKTDILTEEPFQSLSFRLCQIAFFSLSSLIRSTSCYEKENPYSASAMFVIFPAISICKLSVFSSEKLIDVFPNMSGKKK